jgi:hypothetical protein
LSTRPAPATIAALTNPLPLRGPTDHDATERRAWRGVLVLLAALLVVRVVYLLAACPYTLIEDEAHYWEWSRRLEWSYYSKGPGVAWLIAASTSIFGTSEFAVRLPAAVSAFVCGLFIALLARRAFGSARVAFAAVAVFALTPLFQAIGILLTIDMPYSACWAGGVYFAWRALRERSGWAWIGLGAAIGVGFLFKYTILLLVPGVALAAIIGQDRAVHPKAVLLALAAVLVALVGLLPPAIWNAQHDWATVRHLLGHLGLAGGDMKPTQGVGGWTYDPRWTLDFVGTQIGMVGPALGLMIAGVIFARRGRGTLGVAVQAARIHTNIERAAGGQIWDAARFSLLISLPILLFYLGVSFITEPEGNWAMAGYLALFAPAGWAVVAGVDDWRRRVAAWRALPEPRPRAGGLTRRPETVRQVLWHLTLAYGLVAGLGMLRVDWLAAAARTTLGEDAGRAIPVGRLMNADICAAHVARLIEETRARGEGEPFVIGQHYGRASQIAFYLPGRPRNVVFSSSAFMGGRKTQYDMWPETDLGNAETFATLKGRPAIVIGATAGEWAAAFERVEDRGTLEGDHKRGRPVFVALGFKGWAAGSRE